MVSATGRVSPVTGSQWWSKSRGVAGLLGVSIYMVCHPSTTLRAGSTLGLETAPGISSPHNSGWYPEKAAGLLSFLKFFLKIREIITRSCLSPKKTPHNVSLTPNSFGWPTHVGHWQGAGIHLTVPAPSSGGGGDIGESATSVLNDNFPWASHRIVLRFT